MTASDRRAQPGHRSGLDRVPEALETGLRRSEQVLRTSEAWIKGFVGDSLHDLGPPGDVDLVVATYEDQAPTGHLILLVHGLMGTEDVWRFRHDRGLTYASRLAEEVGGTAAFVRYNTGLRIPDNAAALAEALQAELDGWPVPVERLTLIGHSMGGLVLRSAIHQALGADLAWPHRVDHVVMVGSPATGAPLEQGVDVAARTLDAIPLASTRWVAEVLGRRSSGIKDLRHGTAVPDEEGQGPGRPRATDLPLPEGAHLHLVAGTVASDRHQLVSRLVGDVLVPTDSALATELPAEDVLVLGGTHHLALTHHPEVAAHIVRWVSGHEPTRPERLRPPPADQCDG